MEIQSLSSFQYHKDIELRWADLDMQFHVNNAVYVTYIEHARVYYLKDVAQWQFEPNPVVVAELNIKYLRPITKDHLPVVAIKCTKIGNSSMILDYMMYEKTNPELIFAVATTPIVAVDQDGRPAPISSEVKFKVKAFERASA